MRIYFVQHGSNEWQQARNLRYELFFLEHGLPPSVLDDEQELGASHLVAVNDGNVVGSGRLFEFQSHAFRISQMVVSPSQQGRGIGRMILQRLIKEAHRSGAEHVELKARLSVAEFYAKAGFVKDGEVFPSKSTAIPHVNMVLVSEAQA